MAEEKVRQTDRQNDKQTNKQTNETRHSHRHSPRRAKGLSHVTTKAKVIWELFYQKSYQLTHGQNARDEPKIMKEHTQSIIVWPKCT